MSGRIIYDGGHHCGGMPTAVREDAIWQCDDCGQRWVYRIADPLLGLSWRWERIAPEPEPTQKRRWLAWLRA